MRIAAYQMVDGKPEYKILLLKKECIEVRSVRLLHTKKEYEFIPVSYSARRSKEQKNFAILRAKLMRGFLI